MNAMTRDPGGMVGPAGVRAGTVGTRTTALQDPVLTQLHADIRELASEARANPIGRKASLRAPESLLGVEATHFAQHYDAARRIRVPHSHSISTARGA